MSEYFIEMAVHDRIFTLPTADDANGMLLCTRLAVLHRVVQQCHHNIVIMIRSLLCVMLANQRALYQGAPSLSISLLRPARCGRFRRDIARLQRVQEDGRQVGRQRRQSQPRPLVGAERTGVQRQDLVGLGIGLLAVLPGIGVLDIEDLKKVLIVACGTSWHAGLVGKFMIEQIARFVDALFSRIDEFAKPPRHPKWKEASISAVIPGWQRFKAAQDWIDQAKGWSDSSTSVGEAPQKPLK